MIRDQSMHHITWHHIAMTSLTWTQTTKQPLQSIPPFPPHFLPSFDSSFLLSFLPSLFPPFPISFFSFLLSFFPPFLLLSFFLSFFLSFLPFPAYATSSLRIPHRNITIMHFNIWFPHILNYFALLVSYSTYSLIILLNVWSEPATFVSAVLLVAATMLRLGLPHINVLSKVSDEMRWVWYSILHITSYITLNFILYRMLCIIRFVIIHK